MRTTPLLLAGLAWLASTSATAADNYVASYPSIEFGTVSAGARTLDSLFVDLQGVPVPAGALLPIDLNLRGVAATLGASSFLTGNAPVYTGQLQLPGGNRNGQTFTGTSWNDVLDQVKRALTQGGTSRALQAESARSSPFDPVAGNPGSLMARAVAFDFMSSFEPYASNATEGPVRVAQVGGLPPGAVRGLLPTLPGVGAQLALLRDGDRSARALTVPLSLTLRSDLDPRRQVNVSLPITFTDVDGARTVQGTLGAGLRLPLARDWALSGRVGYSMISAKDLGSAGKIASASLTSSYVIRGGGSDLAIGNMLGYYRTLGGSIGGVDAASGISNTVLRNGLLWSMAAPGWLGGNSIEYTLVNTHYSGSELYLRSYSELGVSVGSNKRADSLRSYMQGGISYLFSSRTKGVLASFGYWF